MATQPVIERHVQNDAESGDSGAVSMIVMLVALIAIVGFILLALGVFPFNNVGVAPGSNTINVELEGTLPGNVNPGAMQE